MRHLYCPLLLLLLLAACGPQLPTLAEAEVRFSTQPHALPEDLTYQAIGFAQELINLKTMTVVISGGDRPLPPQEWAEFQPRLPWTKNLDRHLHFDSTAFLRSPRAPVDCEGEDCLTVVTYRDHSWIELAQPVAVSFIPADEETDLLKPDPGHLVVKTIEKCQVVMFTDSVYQLSDGQGNAYVMHASEQPQPDLNVSLPTGWTLRRVALSEPLVVPPFGEGPACYHNILGDHLGQGYHQYQFAQATFPAE